MAQVNIKEAVSTWKNKVQSSIKEALLNDIPPGYSLKRGNVIPTIKALRQLSERHTLSSLLPYESYESDTEIYYNVDSLGFMLIASPATALSLEEIKTLNGFFTQEHKAGTTIQISMMTDTNCEPILDEWQNTKKGADKNAHIFDILAKNRADYFKKGKWASLFKDESLLVRNFHLVISYTYPAPNGVSPHDLGQDVIDLLNRTRLSMQSSLRSARITSENLDPERFINIMNGFLNPLADRQPSLEYNDNELINRQVVDQDTAILFDSGASSLIHQGEAYSVIPFHVKQYPNNWPGYNNGELIGSFLYKVRSIPCQFVATLTVKIPDAISVKSMVKAKSARATQMSDSPVAKFVPQWKDRKRDWDYTSRKIDDGDKLLKSFFQIVLISPQGNEQQCSENLLSLYKSFGWVLSRSRYTPKHAFFGALPMGLSKEANRALDIFGHYSSRLSWTCTNIAPWIAEWKGTKSPLMLFLGRRGQITFFNHFDNNKGNFNIACAATSGAGKSFVTQELVFGILGQNGRVFIIDSGGSYRNICNLLGGTYIDFGEGHPVLNPFSKIFSSEKLARVAELQKKDSDYNIKDYMDDMMPMLTELLSQMASPNGPLDEKLSSCLEKAISAATKEWRDETTITRVVEKCLEQKDENGKTLEYASDLALMLHSYTKDGMFGRYFEGTNNIDMDNPFIVLELDALNSKGPLQPVVLLILMIQINQAMYLSGNRSQKKQVIIDEAWRLMGSGRAGSFIEEGYRVARKHGGSYMTITQTVSDYYKSGTAKAAYMNSDFVWFLRQKGLKTAVKEGHLDDSDGKVQILESLKTEGGKYSEMAITSPDGMSVVRFLVDQVTEKIFSTKAEEVEFLRQAEKKGMNMFDAIQALIERVGSR